MKLHAFETGMESGHHIRVPFPNPQPPKDALYKYKFETPSSIKLVGSYGLKAAARSSEGFTIDVSVTMPDVHMSLRKFSNCRVSSMRKTTWIIGIFTNGLVISHPLQRESNHQIFPFH